MKAIMLIVVATAVLYAQDAPDVLPGQDPLPADPVLPGGTLPGSEPAPDVVKIPPPVEPAPEPAPAPAMPAPPAPHVQPADAAADAVYTVQLGAFKSRERAFALYWELSKKLSHMQVTAPSDQDQMYRVRCGTYPNYDEAKSAAAGLKARGIECFIAPFE
jgi:cell division septation protein DedD